MQQLLVTIIKLVIPRKKSSAILRSSTIGISRDSYLKLINSVTTCQCCCCCCFLFNYLFIFIYEIDQEEREIFGPNHFSLSVLQALQKEAHDKIESNKILHSESEVPKEGYPNTKDFSACALYFQ